MENSETRETTEPAPLSELKLLFELGTNEVGLPETLMSELGSGGVVVLSD